MNGSNPASVSTIEGSSVFNKTDRLGVSQRHFPSVAPSKRYSLTSRYDECEILALETCLGVVRGAPYFLSAWRVHSLREDLKAYNSLRMVRIHSKSPRKHAKSNSGSRFGSGDYYAGDELGHDVR